MQTDTLYTELMNWNRQGARLKEVFSDAILQGRDFLSLKLNHYNRLYTKYAKHVVKTDDMIILNALALQRRRLEKKLYPDILTRIIYRAVQQGRTILSIQVQKRQMKKKYNDDQLMQFSLPVEKLKQGMRQESVLNQVPVNDVILRANSVRRIN